MHARFLSYTTSKLHDNKLTKLHYTTIMIQNNCKILKYDFKKVPSFLISLPSFPPYPLLFSFLPSFPPSPPSFLPVCLPFEPSIFPSFLPSLPFILYLSFAFWATAPKGGPKGPMTCRTQGEFPDVRPSFCLSVLPSFCPPLPR